MISIDYTLLGPDFVYYLFVLQYKLGFFAYRVFLPHFCHFRQLFLLFSRIFIHYWQFILFYFSLHLMDRAPAAALPKQKRLSIEEKLSICKRYSKKVSVKILAADFQVNRQAIEYVIKNRVKYETAAEGGISGIRKSLKTTNAMDVDEILFQWFINQRAAKKEVNGSIFEAQARRIDRRLHPDKPEEKLVGAAWVQRFRARHSVSFKKLSGEAAACPDYSEWLHQFKRGILPLYEPRDVFNADETALMWRACSGFSFVLSGEHPEGGKVCKDRITALVVANMTGTEKLPLSIIGKSKNPRCFTLKGGRKVRMPPNVSYTHSAKAWMNNRIWDAWLNNLNTDMKRQKRKILLAVDNCSAHNTETAYSNLRIEYLPANTTSRCQPMDQGCIHFFKSKFRRRLANMLLDVKSPQDISLLHAIMMASQSWSQVEPQLIRNVFNKAWQMLPEPEVVVVEADELQDADFGSDSQIASSR